ncbi:carbohydrate binding family 9 domain-containing protein [bacterium]|nr:carbohydrate binding family 9 domain-containing protein [bacterium]
MDTPARLRKNNCLKYIVVLIILSLGSLELPLSAFGEEKAPNRVPKIDSSIKVDAVLDEEVWDKALVMELKYEVRPSENVPPPVRTEVLLAYNETHLFAAFRAYDPDPTQIRARFSDRDQLWEDDWVALNFDTFNDERRSFLLVCNPLGIQADNIEETNANSSEWDIIWESQGKITNAGYQVEIAIPFSSMRFQRSDEDQLWGFDAIRSYPRSVRHHIGLFPRDRDNNCYLCQTEKLIGFAGVIPGKNLEIDPTASYALTQERTIDDGISGPFNDSRSEDIGFTAHWGVTPNVTLSTAVNPDFSQVEADASQLDINTQFALYYSERRPFFLNGIEYFNTRLRTVHTRTLADPRWGAKLTGKEGGHSIGAFFVEDEITNYLIPSSQGSDISNVDKKNQSAVIRYKYDIGRSSNIGMVATDRETDDAYNRMGGVDGGFRFTPQDWVRFQYLYSVSQYPVEVLEDEDINDQPESEFYGSAFDVSYNHSTSGLDWYGVYREMTPNFRADLGFIPQVDFRYSEAGLGYTWQEDSDNWWTSLNWGGAYEYEVDFRSTILNRGVGSWFNFSGQRESYFNLYGRTGSRHYDSKEFDLSYVWFEYGFQATGDLSMELEFQIGEQIDYENTRKGNQFWSEYDIVYQFGKHLSTSFTQEYEHLNVSGGRLYTANISYLRLVYQFNPRMFVRTVVQYVDYRFDPTLYEDEQSLRYQALFNQFLFSYKLNPQTVFYLGYSDYSSGEEEYVIRQTNRTVFAKLGYAFVL